MPNAKAVQGILPFLTGSLYAFATLLFLSFRFFQRRHAEREGSGSSEIRG